MRHRDKNSKVSFVQSTEHKKHKKMSVKKGFVFKNKPLRLTTGEFIGVTVDHVNNPESRKAPNDEDDKKSFMFHELCITKDENRAIICSYDGNFIETQESNCTAGGFAVDISFQKYIKGNDVILIKHETQGCRKGGGSRDFQIDGMTGKICFKPLVLGMRKSEKEDKKTKLDGSSTLELVQYDSDRAFRVKSLKVGSVGQFNEPQLLENKDGGFIGRKWAKKKGGKKGSPDMTYRGEYRYMDLCLTTDKSKAVECTYDGQYISSVFPKTVDEKHYYKPYPDCCTPDVVESECVLEFNNSYMKSGGEKYGWYENDHTYCTGTQVRFANNETYQTRLPHTGFQHFQFFPDGQIGVKPLALGKAETGTKLVVVDPRSPNAVQLDLAYLLSADDASKSKIKVRVENNNKNNN